MIKFYHLRFLHTGSRPSTKGLTRYTVWTDSVRTRPIVSVWTQTTQKGRDSSHQSIPSQHQFNRHPPCQVAIINSTLIDLRNLVNYLFKFVKSNYLLLNNREYQYTKQRRVLFACLIWSFPIVTVLLQPPQCRASIRNHVMCRGTLWSPSVVMQSNTDSTWRSVKPNIEL